MSIDLLLKAAEFATNGDPEDKRNFLLGCVGRRSDGALIKSRNGAVITSGEYSDYRIISDAHAECRAIRKLGKAGTLYVARILKLDSSMAMARPCGICRLRIKAAQVEKVYYTIDSWHYGIFDVTSETDKIIELQNELSLAKLGVIHVPAKHKPPYMHAYSN